MIGVEADDAAGKRKESKLGNTQHTYHDLCTETSTAEQWVGRSRALHAENTHLKAVS